MFGTETMVDIFQSMLKQSAKSGLCFTEYAFALGLNRQRIRARKCTAACNLLFLFVTLMNKILLVILAK